MKSPALLPALLLTLAAMGKDPAPPAKPDREPVIELEPLMVHEKPIISFAVDIVIKADPATKTVNRIFITRVLPRTDAERAGLQAGDEIMQLDGTPVKGLDATVAAGTELGRHLLGRDPGEALRFQIFMSRTLACTLRAAEQDNAPTAFATDLVVHANPQTRQVDRIFVSRVRPGSDAEKSGLQKGDEIVKLDDQPVAGLDSALSPESPLGRLLLNRRAGDALRLEAATLRSQEFTLKAQRGLPFDTR